MSDDASKNLSRLADNMNEKRTVNEKMIPFPHVATHTCFSILFYFSHPIEIHTYFSFLNLNNLTVLDALNLSHSYELWHICAGDYTHPLRDAVLHQWHTVDRYFSIHHTSFFIKLLQIRLEKSFT